MWRYCSRVRRSSFRGASKQHRARGTPASVTCADHCDTSQRLVALRSCGVAVAHRAGELLLRRRQLQCGEPHQNGGPAPARLQKRHGCSALRRRGGKTHESKVAASVHALTCGITNPLPSLIVQSSGTRASCRAADTRSQCRLAPLLMRFATRATSCASGRSAGTSLRRSRRASCHRLPTTSCHRLPPPCLYFRLSTRFVTRLSCWLVQACFRRRLSTSTRPHSLASAAPRMWSRRSYNPTAASCWSSATRSALSPARPATRRCARRPRPALQVASQRLRSSPSKRCGTADNGLLSRKHERCMSLH